MKKILIVLCVPLIIFLIGWQQTPTVDALKVLTINTGSKVISSSNVELVGGSLQLVAGQNSGEIVYQVSGEGFSKFLKVVEDETAETIKNVAIPAGLVGWNREYGRAQISDVITQVSTSSDNSTWSNYFPDNISGATSMVPNTGNILPPRTTFYGPQDSTSFTWGNSGDAEGTGLIPGFLSRQGPGNALVISNAIKTGSYFAEIAISERITIQGAERLTWGMNLYQAQVAASNPRQELDYSRLELQGGTGYDNTYQVYPAPNTYTLDSTDYFLVNGGGFGQKAATWKFMLMSAVPPSDTKACYARWFRSMQGTQLTGMGSPFMMLTYNPIRAFGATDITPKFTEAWDYADIAAATSAGWTFDVTNGGTNATIAFDNTYHVWSPRGQSLKMSPKKGTAGQRKYVVATGPVFAITPGVMTTLQYDQKTVSDSPDGGNGVPATHHYQVCDVILKFYSDAGSTQLDAMSLGRERSDFSTHATNDKTNYICQVAPVTATYARIVISADFNNASGCPAGMTTVDHWIDGIRVDQFAWGSDELNTIAQTALPRLDLPGNEVTLNNITPANYIRVKVKLRRWDSTHGNPSFRSIKFIGI